MQDITAPASGLVDPLVQEEVPRTGEHDLSGLLALVHDALAAGEQLGNVLGRAEDERPGRSGQPAPVESQAVRG